MTHYTYLLVFQNGMMYHGVRSFKGSPHEDKYMGSGIYLPEDRSTATKLVLTQHFTREEAQMEEILWQAAHNVLDNPRFFNQVNAVKEEPQQVEATGEPANSDEILSTLGTQTVQVLKVEFVKGTIFDKIWQRNDMQLITTDRGQVIDNMVKNTYNVSGHDWTSVIGKKVKVSVYLGKHNRTVVKKMPFMKPI